MPIFGIFGDKKDPSRFDVNQFLMGDIVPGSSYAKSDIEMARDKPPDKSYEDRMTEMFGEPPAQTGTPDELSYGQRMDMMFGSPDTDPDQAYNNVMENIDMQIRSESAPERLYIYGAGDPMLWGTDLPDAEEVTVKKGETGYQTLKTAQTVGWQFLNGFGWGLPELMIDGSESLARKMFPTRYDLTDVIMGTPESPPSHATDIFKPITATEGAIGGVAHFVGMLAGPFKQVGNLLGMGKGTQAALQAGKQPGVAGLRWLSSVLTPVAKEGAKGTALRLGQLASSQAVMLAMVEGAMNHEGLSEGDLWGNIKGRTQSAWEGAKTGGLLSMFSVLHLDKAPKLSFLLRQGAARMTMSMMEYWSSLGNDSNWEDKKNLAQFGNFIREQFDTPDEAMATMIRWGIDGWVVRHGVSRSALKNNASMAKAASEKRAQLREYFKEMGIETPPDLDMALRSNKDFMEWHNRWATEMYDGPFKEAFRRFREASMQDASKDNVEPWHLINPEIEYNTLQKLAKEIGAETFSRKKENLLDAVEEQMLYLDPYSAHDAMFNAVGRHMSRGDINNIFRNQKTQSQMQALHEITRYAEGRRAGLDRDAAIARMQQYTVFAETGDSTLPFVYLDDPKRTTPITHPPGGDVRPQEFDPSRPEGMEYPSQFAFADNRGSLPKDVKLEKGKMGVKIPEVDEWIVVDQYEWEKAAVQAGQRRDDGLRNFEATRRLILNNLSPESQKKILSERWPELSLAEKSLEDVAMSYLRTQHLETVNKDILDVYKDPLTGFYGREAVHPFLKGAAKRAIAGKHNVTLWMIDINNLGRINKEMGHNLGDRLFTHLRDVVGEHPNNPMWMKLRPGGDELMVITSLRPEDGRAQAQQIRDVYNTSIDSILRQEAKALGIEYTDLYPGIEVVPVSYTPEELLAFNMAGTEAPSFDALSLHVDFQSKASPQLERMKEARAQEKGYKRTNTTTPTKEGGTVKVTGEEIQEMHEDKARTAEQAAEIQKRVDKIIEISERYHKEKDAKKRKELKKAYDREKAMLKELDVRIVENEKGRSKSKKGEVPPVSEVLPSEQLDPAHYYDAERAEAFKKNVIDPLLRAGLSKEAGDALVRLGWVEKVGNKYRPLEHREAIKKALKEGKGKEIANTILEPHKDLKAVQRELARREKPLRAKKNRQLMEITDHYIKTGKLETVRLQEGGEAPHPMQLDMGTMIEAGGYVFVLEGIDGRGRMKLSDPVRRSDGREMEMRDLDDALPVKVQITRQTDPNSKQQNVRGIQFHDMEPGLKKQFEQQLIESGGDPKQKFEFTTREGDPIDADVARLLKPVLENLSIPEVDRADLMEGMSNVVQESYDYGSGKNKDGIVLAVGGITPEGFVDFVRSTRKTMRKLLKGEKLEGAAYLSKKDLNSMARIIQTPHDIGMSHPIMGRIYGVAESDFKTKIGITSGYMDYLRDYNTLNSQDRRNLNRVFYVEDKLGHEHSRDELMAGRRQATAEGEPEGPFLFQPLNEAQMKAYENVRRFTHQAVDDIANGMLEAGLPGEKVLEWRESYRGWMPHTREGDTSLAIVKKTGKMVKDPKTGEMKPEENLVWFERFETRPGILRGQSLQERLQGKDKFTFGGVRKANRRIKELANNQEWLDANGLTKEELLGGEGAYKFARVYKHNELPPDFYDVNYKSIESILEKAQKQELATPESIAEVTEAFRRILAQRGFSIHMTKRKGTEGYIKDFRRPLATYAVKLGSFLSRLKHTPMYEGVLREVDPQAQPNLWQYAKSYINYQIQPSSKMEMAWLRSMLFDYMIAGKVSSALVNGTANLMFGAPLLGMHLEGNWAKRIGGARKRMLKSLEDVVQHNLSGGLSENMTPHEAEALEWGIKNGQLQAQWLQEITDMQTGRITGFGPGQAVRDFIRSPFQMVEQYVNRETAFLSFYRAFAEKGFSHQRAKEKALEWTLNSHFRYGKFNRPMIGRKLGAPFFVFRSFVVQAIELQKNLMLQKYTDPETGVTAARQWQAMGEGFITATLLGGLASSIPMWKQIRQLAIRYWGEDPEDMVRNRLSRMVSNPMAGEILGDIMTHGGTSALPDEIAFDLSGSLALNVLPLEFEPHQGEMFDLSRTIAELGGAPLGLVHRIDSARDALNRERGEIELPGGIKMDAGKVIAAENLLWDFARNIIRAWRLHGEGALTRGGKAVVDPATGQVYHYNTIQAIMKSLGLQPRELNAIYEYYQGQKLIETRGAAIKRKLLDRLASAAARNDKKTVGKIFNDIKAHNSENWGEASAFVSITQTDINRRLSRDWESSRYGAQFLYNKREWDTLGK